MCDEKGSSASAFGLHRAEGEATSALSSACQSQLNSSHQPLQSTGHGMAPRVPESSSSALSSCILPQQLLQGVEQYPHGPTQKALHTSSQNYRQHCRKEASVHSSCRVLAFAGAKFETSLRSKSFDDFMRSFGGEVWSTPTIDA